MPEITITWARFTGGLKTLMSGQTVQIILTVLMLLTCFLGFKIFTIWMGAAGLAIGLIAGYYVPMHIFHTEQLVGFIAALIAGILLMLILAQVENIGMFAFGGLFVMSLGYAFMHPLSQTRWIVLAVCGIIFGVLANIFEDTFRVYGTAIGGALAGSYFGVYRLFGKSHMIFLVVAAVLAICGIAVQLLVSGIRREKKLEKEKKKKEKSEIRKKASPVSNLESVVSEEDEDDFIEFQDLSSSADRKND